MVEIYSTSLRNTLSACVPSAVKSFLVATVLFGPTTGRVIRLLGPRKNVHGIRFDLNSTNLAIREVANLYFNRRERAELDLVRRHIMRSDVTQVVELGASIGFIAANLVFTKQVEYLGVEASPRLAREAELNIDRNNRWGSAWRIVNRCLDYSGRDEVEFGERASSLIGKVGNTNKVGKGATVVRVPAATFGGIVRKHGLRDFALIADVEGVEADLLFRDAESLRDCRIMVAELEDTAEYTIDQQVARARELGFELEERFRNVFAFRRRMRPH
jgi:FkbM family methyltransferase